jgi:hypothetical protein
MTRRRTPRLPLAQIEGPPVVLQGLARLAQVIEADGQVEGVVSVAAVRAVGAEVGLLGLGPAPLGGVEVAEGEVQVRRIRVLGQRLLQAGLALGRGDTSAGTEVGDGGRRHPVLGVLDQHPAVDRLRLLALAEGRGDGAEAEQGVTVARVAREHLAVELPRLLVTAGLEGLVGPLEPHVRRVGLAAGRHLHGGRAARAQRGRLVPNCRRSCRRRGRRG